jgi:limonene-1,2-epoxide hydrolase
MVMSTAFGTLAAMLGSTIPTKAADTSSEKEQAAIKVVSDFIGAWPTRDVDQIASHVGDDFIFKGAPNAMEKKGKQTFIAEISRFVNGPMSKTLTFAQRPSEVYAIGGAAGTVVLARRVDFMSRGGQRMAVPLAGAYWVTDDKVQAWYDFPLVKMRPPGGGGAGGDANPGPPGGQ